MKIYIKTDTQPPRMAATVNTQTDATGTLRVYSASGSSGISNFKFKRGTTVPVEIFFTDAETAAEISKLRFGIKRAGRYDDILVLAAETTAEDGTVTFHDDGSVSFRLSLRIDAAAIDAALGVNGNATDDLAQADFISEIEWENDTGGITATETVSTTILNNVVRGTANAAGPQPGAWTALMVIRMNWAEFSALEEKNPDAIYIVPDAPDPVAEHAADPAAHGDIFRPLQKNIDERFDHLSERVSEAANAAAQIPAVLPASDTVSGTVKTGGDGVSTLNNVLTLNLRSNHSGLAFESRALHVNTGTNDHPASGASVPVGTDAAGKLCVPAIPPGTGELAAAAAPRHAPILTMPVFNDAYLGFPIKVLCPAIDNNANIRGFYGTLGELLQLPVDAAPMEIFPTAITAYRKQGGTDNTTKAMFMRILRKNADGEWRVAFESTNQIRSGDYPTAGEPMTWHLSNTDGYGPIPTDEPVAIVQTPAKTNIATATDSWGAKTTSLISGAILPGNDLAEDNRQSWAPALDIAYQQTLPLYDLISTIFAEIESLKEGLEA